mmetsp:Transcript_13287/g.36445  ORF Transcript_13287/g.36445 Transcript_13287/m.36445 type:complete len:407 (+) Transcript_13287:1224-2444(+)
MRKSWSQALHKLMPTTKCMDRIPALVDSAALRNCRNPKGCMPRSRQWVVHKLVCTLQFLHRAGVLAASAALHMCTGPKGFLPSSRAEMLHELLRTLPCLHRTVMSAVSALQLRCLGLKAFPSRFRLQGMCRPVHGATLVAGSAVLHSCKDTEEWCLGSGQKGMQPLALHQLMRRYSRAVDSEAFSERGAGGGVAFAAAGAIGDAMSRSGVGLGSAAQLLRGRGGMGDAAGGVAFAAVSGTAHAMAPWQCSKLANSEQQAVDAAADAGEMRWPAQPANFEEQDQPAAGAGVEQQLLGVKARAPFRAPRVSAAAASSAARSVVGPPPTTEDGAGFSLLGPAARQQFRRPRTSAAPAAACAVRGAGGLKRCHSAGGGERSRSRSAGRRRQGGVEPSGAIGEQRPEGLLA